MKKLVALFLFALIVIGLGCPSAALAGHRHHSRGVRMSFGFRPAPTYYRPAPARYRPAPVVRRSYHRSYYRSGGYYRSYYAPAPVYVTREPVYYAPRPVIVEQPVYVVQPAVVQTPPPPTTAPEVPAANYEPIVWKGKVHLFQETDRRYHQQGGDRGLLDWRRGRTPDGHELKIEYSDNGAIKEVDD